MELRKSLEKAKQQRLETGADPVEKLTKTEKGSVEMAWQAPAYTKSGTVKIDRKIAEAMRCVSLFPETPESHYYDVLRTQIQHITQEKGWNTILVTSTRPGEGKTLTCINLALSMARTFNQTVLLVDNDLKRQNIHKYFGIKSKLGLFDYLVNDVSLEDIILWPEIEKLSLISGGKTINASSELLGSPKLKKLVLELKSRYSDRYVLFDTPPILGNADTIAFAPLVDGILLVVEAQNTDLEEIQKAHAMIPEEKFLGFVLNRQKVPMQSYHYYYH